MRGCRTDFLGRVAGVCLALALGIPPGLAQTGLAQTGLAQTGLAQTGSTQTGSTQTGSTQTGSTQTGSTQTGSTQTGSTQTGSTQAGGGQTGSTPSPVAAGVAGETAASSEEAAPPLFIAHAGGAVRQRTYTNSREALDRAAGNGYRLVEIDLHWTSDDELVLIHDWDHSLRSLFVGEYGAPREQSQSGAQGQSGERSQSGEQARPRPQPLTLAEFRAAESRWGLTQLALDDLGPWLERHPDVDLVTDIKARNLEGLRRIAVRFPDDLDRFVPQLYHVDQHGPVRAMGFERVILTLYAAPMEDDEVERYAVEQRPFAITMPIDRGRSDLPARLGEVDTFVYAHTVNGLDLLEELRGSGVDGVYTDWLVLDDVQRGVYSGPWAEWTAETDGTTAFPQRVLCFVPPAEAGFAAEVLLHATGSVPCAAELAVLGDGADLLGRRRVELQPGQRATIDLHELAGSVLLAWARIDAPADVDCAVRVRRGELTLPWSWREVAFSTTRVAGQGDGISGHMLLVLNPTAETQTYRIERHVERHLIDAETVVLRPGHQHVRVYGVRTEGEVELRVEGGPALVETLRWNADMSFMR